MQVHLSFFKKNEAKHTTLVHWLVNLGQREVVLLCLHTKTKKIDQKHVYKKNKLYKKKKKKKGEIKTNKNNKNNKNNDNNNQNE